MTFFTSTKKCTSRSSLLNEENLKNKDDEQNSDIID